MFTTHPGEPPLVHLRASHFHQAIVALAAPTSPALINTQKHKNIFYKNFYIRNLQLHLTSSTLFYAFNNIVSRDSTNANTVYIFRCYCLPLLLSGLLDSPPFFASDWWMIICLHVSIYSYQVEAELIPDRHRCSHCNSSVCVFHTPSLSGSPEPHTPSREASEAEVDTDHSSVVVWTGSGLGTHSPAWKIRAILIKSYILTNKGTKLCCLFWYI